MGLVWLSAATALAILFRAHRAHCRHAERRRRCLRERVAYMLWIMAEEADGTNGGLSAPGNG